MFSPVRFRCIFFVRLFPLRDLSVHQSGLRRMALVILVMEEVIYMATGDDN